MPHPARPNAKSVAELIGPSLDPLVRKRGLARAELLAWWPDIVGEAYARHTMPERIRWARDGRAATLVIKCDPSLALQLSYETDRIRERLNTFLGYAAIGAVRIVQHPMNSAPKPEGRKEQLSPAAAERLAGRLAGVEGPLRDSLLALGRAVLART